MTQYVCISQHYPGPKANLTDVSAEISRQEKNKTFARTIYYKKTADADFGTAVYEVIENGLLKLVATNYDTSG